jgi:hypothetical protein
MTTPQRNDTGLECFLSTLQLRPELNALTNWTSFFTALRWRNLIHFDRHRLIGGPPNANVQCGKHELDFK